MKYYGGNFELDEKLDKLNNLQIVSSDPLFWNDPRKANKIAKEISSLNCIIKPILNIKNNIDILYDYKQLLEQSDDEQIAKEYEKLYNDTQVDLKNQEMLTYLGGEFDNMNAIFEVHAGAGGTESCDWVQMLIRMYLRYFDKKGYVYEKVDEQLGEETGIKSVTYIVKGEFAYGYLSAEKGVHRLVRISPFDSNKRRHTSFAAVDVIPQFEDDIEVEIKDSDIKVDVYRSSGPGGQGVNTTDSAVRITHLPTGITVTCQNERSQIKNKETALKILKSKLYQINLKNKQSKIDSIKSDHNEINFGSQIRSYVLHPYLLIKDHRTNHETSNVTKIFDGNLDEFVNSVLKERKNETI